MEFSVLVRADSMESAIVARFDKELSINPDKPLCDMNQAIASLKMFPDHFEKGASILFAALDIDVEQFYDAVANPKKAKGMKNDPHYFNQKSLDKVIRLCQWFGGVTDEMVREKTKNSHTKRTAVMDAHLNNMIFDTYTAFTRLGVFGDVKKSTELSMHEFRSMQSYNYAADRADVKADTDAIRMKYFNLGACDYAISTSSTQASQIKTMLITMKMVDVEKAIKDDFLHFNVNFAKLIAKTMKVNKIKRTEEKR